MTSQQEADRALAEHWAEREQKEREQRQQKRRVIVVGDHQAEIYRGDAACGSIDGAAIHPSEIIG